MVTRDPAGAVIVFLSKAIFFAVSDTDMLFDEPADVALDPALGAALDMAFVAAALLPVAFPGEVLLEDAFLEVAFAAVPAAAPAPGPPADGCD